MLWKELIFDFVNNNKKTIFGYIIVVFLTFPVESVALPQMYSKLFESVRLNKKLPGIEIFLDIKFVLPVLIIFCLFFIRLVYRLNKSKNYNGE